MSRNRKNGCVPLLRLLVAVFVSLAKGGLAACCPCDGNGNDATGQIVNLTFLGDAAFAARMNPSLGQALSLVGAGGATSEGYK